MDLTAFHHPGSLLALLAAAFIVGLSKGGLAGVGVMAVPVLALALPPVQAAGILLPLLCLSDLFSMYAWWGEWDRRTLWLMLPGAILGIGIGWATAALVPEPVVLLLVGVIALAFVGRWLVLRRAGPQAARAQRPAAGQGWGAVAGYTSFVAHAGGPPFQVYALPLGLSPRVLTSTSVIFFAIVNYVKLIPYLALGQFDATNLALSGLLAPVAVAATYLGAWIVRRMRAEVFYPITYALTALVGLKLVWDGLLAL